VDLLGDKIVDRDDVIRPERRARNEMVDIGPEQFARSRSVTMPGAAS
jgi:hypothetical protein